MRKLHMRGWGLINQRTESSCEAITKRTLTLNDLQTLLAHFVSAVSSTPIGRNTLALALLIYCSTLSDPLFAQTFQRTGTISGIWDAVAASADGRILLAVNGGYNGAGGLIYFSSNAGVSWKPATAPVRIWTSVATSADGVNSVAVAYGDGVYVSTNSAATWMLTSAPLAGWNASAASADGKKLFAAMFGGQIYSSTNSGATWAPTTAPIADWYAVGASTDGSKVVAGVGGSVTVPSSVGFIYISSDSGKTWQKTSSPINNWAYVACSADGTKIVGVVYEGRIFTSRDSGLTWVTTSAPVNAWVGAASSADGTTLVGIPNGNQVYISRDSGTNWTSSSILNGALWAAACSADGTRILVADDGVPPPGGGLYLSQSNPRPVLSLTRSGTNLVASWTVPSMPFTLQVNSDLTTTNWTDLSVPAPLNYSTLRNEALLPFDSTNQLFRLKH